MLENKLLTYNWDLYDCAHPVMKTGINPIWLFLKATAEHYFFYLEKWLRSKFSNEKDKQPVFNEKYLQLVRNASRFLSRNVFKYIKDFFMLPLDALKLWILLKKPKMLKRKLFLELLNRDPRMKLAMGKYKIEDVYLSISASEPTSRKIIEEGKLNEEKIRFPHNSYRG